MKLYSVVKFSIVMMVFLISGCQYSLVRYEVTNMEYKITKTNKNAYSTTFGDFSVALEVYTSKLEGITLDFFIKNDKSSKLKYKLDQIELFHKDEKKLILFFM